MSDRSGFFSSVSAPLVFCGIFRRLIFIVALHPLASPPGLSIFTSHDFVFYIFLPILFWTSLPPVSFETLQPFPPLPILFFLFSKFLNPDCRFFIFSRLTPPHPLVLLLAGGSFLAHFTRLGFHFLFEFTHFSASRFSARLVRPARHLFPHLILLVLF